MQATIARQKPLKRSPRYTLARLMKSDGEELAYNVDRRPYPTYSSQSAAKRDAKLMNLGLDANARWRYVVIEL